MQYKLPLKPSFISKTKRADATPKRRVRAWYHSSSQSSDCLTGCLHTPSFIRRKDRLCLLGFQQSCSAASSPRPFVCLAPYGKSLHPSLRLLFRFTALWILFTKSFCRQNLFREDFFLVVKTLNARNKFALAFFRRHLFSLLIAAYIFYACATLTRGPPRCIACRKYSRKTFDNKTFP